MIKTATVPLRGVRTNALVVPINFVGIDLTSATVTAVVLQNWDNDPADPEIALTETPNGNGSGVVVGTVTTTSGVPTSPVTLTIGAADMAAIPDAAEVGTDVNWVWYLMIQTDAGNVNTKQRYLEGAFYVGGSSSGTGGTGVVTATIVDSEITVAIDGVSFLAPILAAAEDYSDLARDWAAKESGEVDAADYPGKLSALQYAELAESWAEGTEPGGPGTKSAEEWAGEAEGFRNEIDPDTIETYPSFGLENIRNPHVQTDDVIQRYSTRDGFTVETQRAGTAGVDYGTLIAAHVGASGLAFPGGEIPATPNWPDDDLTFSLAGFVDGKQIVTTSRPWRDGFMPLMIGANGDVAPVLGPDDVILMLGDGQSLSTGTNGRWYSSTAMYSTLALPANVWMPRRNAQSDVRISQYADWDSGLSVAADADSIVGLTPLRSRGLWSPSNTAQANWTSQVFGETILERASKVVSDRIYAVTERRPMIVSLTIGFGGVNIDNMQKAGASNIPGQSVTKYANNIAVLTKVASILSGMNKRVVGCIVLRKHGESSSADAAYQTKATQQISDLRADLKSIFGFQQDAVVVENVTSAFAPASTASVRALRAMHEAGTLHIAGPDYPVLARQGFVVSGVPTPPNPDYVHMTARGYAVVGEDMAHAAYDALFLNQRRAVVQPLSAVASGNTIDVTFDSPSGEIEIAASPGFTAPTNAGFLYGDSTGGITISSVAAVAPNIIRLTMSASVAGRTGRWISVAENSVGGGASATDKPRSTVRDPASLGTSDVDGVERYAWAIPAYQAVTGA